MNVTSIPKNMMLVLLLSCPLAKAGYSVDQFLKVENLKHLLLAGFAGYAAKKVDDTAQITKKATGGKVTSDNLRNVVTNLTYSLSQENKLNDPKEVIAHGASAVATETALSTSIGKEIVENTPVLGDLYKTHQSVASFLVYLGVDSLVSPVVKNILGTSEKA